MLKIRFNRTGKSAQPSFRIVVQEHTAPAGGKFIEALGNYNPIHPKKEYKINSERVKYWLSVGAQPSDALAVILKKEGFSDMDKFIEPRTKQRKSKKAPKEEPAPAVESATETPAAEPAPAPEAQAEPAPEAPAEVPTPESTPKPPAEEHKSEEPPQS